MSYRNITVNGKTYKWISGKTHLKIAGFGIFRIEDVGIPIKHQSYSEGIQHRVSGYVVGPHQVRQTILGEPGFVPFPCRRHPEIMVTGLIENPYCVEIEGKQNQMHNCPVCYDEQAMEI